MNQRISRMSEHYIICGFGRMGQEIARQFERARKPFVIVEHNPEQIPTVEAADYPFVQGDAREDEHLIRAGIERARGLIAVAGTDEENVYIILSARVLNPNLYIVTRCSSTAGEGKLLRAGADRVFSPYIVGGRRMAQAVLRPSAVEFLDTVVHGEQVELVLEDVEIGEDAPIRDKVVLEHTDEETLGVHVLGIATADGRMLMRGLDTYLVRAGDILILLGEPEAMQAAIKRLTGRDMSAAPPPQI